MSAGQEEEERPVVGTIFFSSTYEEALALTREARDYLAGPGQEAVKGLSVEQRFDYATESLRMTTQLTEGMSWLFFQRAVQAGEITPEEAQGKDCHLQHADVCLPEKARDISGLPDGLINLLERSEHLYRRIARLDQRAIHVYERARS
jgi:regulator of CtrA degradation